MHDAATRNHSIPTNIFPKEVFTSESLFLVYNVKVLFAVFFGLVHAGQAVFAHTAALR